MTTKSTKKREGRLAKGRDGVERPWTVTECYQLYARGFRDGAGTRAMRSDHVGLSVYDRGYADGCAATRAACTAYAKEIGHSASILRVADGE